MVSIKFYIPEIFNQAITNLHASHKNMERSARVKAIPHKDGYALVDMYFPKQKNQTAHTEMTEEWVTEFGERLFENDVEEQNYWNLWLHSHHTMWLFWSWTDEATKQSFHHWWFQHFFSIVTWHWSGSWWTKFWNNRYKWCVNFYEYDYEVEAEFEIGLWFEDSILEKEVEFEEKYKEELKALEESFKERAKEIKTNLRATISEEVNWSLVTFNEYVNSVVKKEVVWDMSKSIESEYKKREANALSDLLLEIWEAKKEVINRKNAERQTLFWKHYEDMILEEARIVKVDPNKVVADLTKAEIKPISYLTDWSKKKRNYQKKCREEKEEEEEEENDYKFEEYGSKLPPQVDMATPKWWHYNNYSCSWDFPKSRLVHKWEHEFFDDNWFYWDSSYDERYHAAFYKTQVDD